MRQASVFVGLLAAALAGSAFQVAPPASNPVPYTKASITRGKAWFAQNCPLCHGDDGKAQGSAIAVAADLTAPSLWKYGASDAQIFSTIRNGAGDNMPAFGGDLKDQQIWELVNFIRSIGPEDKKPKGQLN